MRCHRPSSASTRLLLAGLAPALLGALAVGCSSAVPPEESGASTSALSGNDLSSLALANLGGTACGTNSLGGHAFYSSCTGNGGQPEYWCSDFVKWVWANSGADVTGLTAASGSFYTYGQRHGTLSNTPSVGAAVVFDYAGGGVADHVAIVTAVNPNGTIETVSGDWNGQDGSEAHFSATSHVIANRPAYGSAVGSTPGIIGMTISGYITPAGSGIAPGPGGTPAPAGGGGGGGDCAVHPDDHRLYCDVSGGPASMHADPTLGSPVVNTLRTAYSWFDCWGTGDRHAGGNTTWYHTQGDDNASWGWVPGVALETPDAFDANPTAQGLPRCP
jgi:surface antigen